MVWLPEISTIWQQMEYFGNHTTFGFCFDSLKAIYGKLNCFRSLILILSWFILISGGSRISQGGCQFQRRAPNHYWAKWFWKLHENEENWTGGACKICLCRSFSAKWGQQNTILWKLGNPAMKLNSLKLGTPPSCRHLSSHLTQSGGFSVNTTR